MVTYECECGWGNDNGMPTITRALVEHARYDHVGPRDIMRMTATVVDPAEYEGI